MKAENTQTQQGQGNPDNVVVVSTNHGPQKVEVVIKKGENGEPGEVIRVQSSQNHF